MPDRQTVRYIGCTAGEARRNHRQTMTRTQQLQAFTVRQLRIYGRKQGVAVRQAWSKPELIAAIVAAGK